MTHVAEQGRLRCNHCGRAVRETLHARESWSVDYYLLHTGEVEPTTLASEALGGVISFLKLIRPIDVITCADCYRDPAVRGDLDKRFRPELYADLSR